MCCFSKNKLTVNSYLKTQKHIHETKQQLYSASLCSKRLNHAVQTILRSLLLQTSGVLNVSEDKRFHILSEHLFTRLMVQNKQAPKIVIIKKPQTHPLKTFSKVISRVRISTLSVFSPYMYSILGEINMTFSQSLV